MMKRRQFIQKSIYASIAAAVLTRCTDAASGTTQGFDVVEKDVSALQQAMTEGKITAKELVQLYLDRIEAVDKSGPTLNSVIEVNPDALSIAEALDKERAAGKVRGPLHGIPVMIKDNIDTKDKMMTTAGSLALLGSIAPEDAWVAAKLREAGCVILGKTNLSEWANFRADFSSSGWSGRGGQTKNPYVLDRNPCGSSSGSGASVSASLCAITIGTETNGSIVCPSNANGIVGIKPTVGLVGRSGIIPISHTQDTAGPMARTVADATALLGALTGIDPRDEATQASEGKFYGDYTQFLDKNGLNGAKIGVARNFFGFHDKVDEVLEEGIEAMKKAGATIVELEDAVAGRGVGGAAFQVLLYEFKAGMNAYLATLGDDAPVKSLADIIEFNKKNDTELKYFDQDLLVMANEKGDLNTPEYLDALKEMQTYYREEGIDKIMEENELDAIVAPTGSPAWTIDLINGDRFLGGSSSPAARSGYPNITVPAGFVDALPIGLSFFGRAWSEPTLIKVAYAFEQATQHRKAPEYLEHL